MTIQIEKQTRQPHLGRRKMYEMTSFPQVKQVKSYPGLLSQVPLLCECAQRAVHYICNLAARQEPREDVLQLGLTVPCLCVCCVWSRCQQLKGSKCQFKLSHFLPFCLCSSTSIFDAALHVDILCVCSTSLLCPAFLALSFLLEGALKFIRTSGSCLLSAACPVFWSLSLFGKVDMNVGVLQRFLCPFLSIRSGTMSSLS